MRTFTGLAVTGLMLSLASPAAAQGRTVEGGEYNTSRAVASAMRYSARSPGYASQPAGPASTRIVGGVSLSENAAVGLGLFSVVGPTEKEIVRRRTEPRGDFTTRDARVAAVGFSLRF